MRRSIGSAAPRQSETTEKDAESFGESADPFLLDFGTSVAVNEELRRTIRSEIKEIDTSAEELKLTIKTEERAQTQLTQDFKHAHNELKNIGRGTTEQLEKAVVHSRVVSGLGETIRVELVEPTVVGSSDLDGLHGRGEEKNDGSSNQTTVKAIPLNYNVIIKRTKESLKTLVATFKEASSRAAAAAAEKASIIESIQAIHDRIECEKLVEIERSARRDTETRKKDEEDELARKVGLQTYIERSLVEREKQYKRLAENTKLMRLEQQENAMLEEKLKKQLQEIDAEVAATQATLSTSKASLSTREVELSHLRQQNSEIDRCRKHREETVVETKMEQGEIEKLSRIHEDLNLNYENAKAESIAANNALLEADTAATAAAEAKASNDRVHESQMLPGEMELEGLAKEKGNVPSLIEELDEKIIAMQREYDQELSDLSEQRALLIKEREEVKEERKGRQSGQVVFASTRTESQENWGREIKEHYEEGQRNQESIRAQEARIAELRKEGEQNRSIRIEAAKTSAARALAERTRELDVLRLGAELIEHMQHAEHQLMQD